MPPSPAEFAPLRRGLVLAGWAPAGPGGILGLDMQRKEGAMRQVGSWIERAVLGMGMAVVAWFVERRLLRAMGRDRLAAG